MEGLKLWITLLVINILLLIWRYGLKELRYYESKIWFSILPINFIYFPFLLVDWYIDSKDNNQKKKIFGKYYDEVKILDYQRNIDVLSIKKKYKINKKKGLENCEKYFEEKEISIVVDKFHDELKKIKKKIRIDENGGVDPFEIKKQEIKNNYEKALERRNKWNDFKHKHTMDINCINNQIANANGVLQPTILKAILRLYQNGNNRMTARDVKQECFNLDNTIPWDGRIPAICNTMRNAIDCGGEIIGENVDFLDFTIVFYY